MHQRSHSVVIASCLLLSACFGGSSDTAGKEGGESAKSGVVIAAVLAGENLLSQAFNRPTSVLGVYVTSFLSGNAVAQTRSALDGIQAQLQLYFGQQADTAAVSSVLEQLGTTLQVSIPELLNRSSDRSKTLDEYIAFLETAATEARAVYDDLGVQRKELDAQSTLKRKEVTTLKRDVDRAVKNKDFALAGGNQELLGIAQAKLSEIDTERKQLQSTQELLKDLLEIGKERHTAILQNRDALIAGVTVVDVPGVDDLGVLRNAGRSVRNSSSSPFGNF